MGEGFDWALIQTIIKGCESQKGNEHDAICKECFYRRDCEALWDRAESERLGGLMPHPRDQR